METSHAFKIALVSDAPNGFGLWGVVIVSSDGLCFEVGLNKKPETEMLAATLQLTIRNGVLVPRPDFFFEIPTYKGIPPEAVIAEAWGKAAVASIDWGETHRLNDQIKLAALGLANVKHAPLKLSIEHLLESPHTYGLQWSEPWSGLDEAGKPCDAHVVYHCSIHGCVAMSRRSARDSNHMTSEKALPEDRDLLMDFMAVHWATPCLMPPPLDTNE